MRAFRSASPGSPFAHPPRPPKPPRQADVAAAPLGATPRGGRMAKERRWARHIISFHSIVLYVALGLFPAAGCSTPQVDGEATLSLSFGRVGAARAFAPPALEVARYAMTLTASDGTSSSTSFTQTNKTLRLAAGRWTILVEAQATDGTRLASGSLSIDLAPGEERSATIILNPETGVGSVTISWSTVGQPSGTLEITGELRSGETIFPLSGTGTAGSISQAEIPAGAWRIVLSLSNQAGKLAGLADSVLVVSGRETAVSVVFEPPKASLVLSLVNPTICAQSLALLPPVRRIAAGGETSFSVDNSGSGGSWYRNGDPIIGDGSMVSFIPATASEDRIDWVSAIDSSARSASGRMIVSGKVDFGPFSWSESLLKADYGAMAAGKALDGCRDLVFSSDGSALVLAAKDGNAVGEFALSGGHSPTPTSTLLASDVGALASAELVAALPQGRGFLLLATGSGSLLRLARQGDGRLAPSATLVVPEFTSATALAVDPSGRFAWIASDVANSIIRVELDASGMPLSAVAVARSTTPGFELLSRPTALALSPDGSLLAFGSSGDDAVWLCQVDPMSGNLSLLARLDKTAISPVGSLSDPVDLAFSSDGASIFALSYFGKSIIRIDRTAAGTWIPVAAAKSGSGSISGFDYPKHLAISPDGRWVVVSGSGAADGLAAFDIGSPGSLVWLASLLPNDSPGRPSKPGALAFSPDGSSLAVACPEDDSLHLFRLTTP